MNDSRLTAVTLSLLCFATLALAGSEPPALQVGDTLRQILGPPGRTVSREELLRPPALSPLFRPRPAAPPAGPATAPAPGAAASRSPLAPGPLPPAWPPIDEDPELLRYWAQMQPSTETLHAAIQEALAMPDERVLNPKETERTLGPSRARWQEIGTGIVDPDGVHHRSGRVTSLAYAYDDVQRLVTVWAGASGGGLWKLVFSGLSVSWQPVSGDLPGAPSVGSFLIHPLGSNGILIGTGDRPRYAGDGIYRMIDGVHWTRPALNPCPRFVFKIISDSSVASRDRVLAATDNGIWSSPDFGATWTRVYASDSMITDLVQDPIYPDYWWAARVGQGILESANNGQEFHLMAGTGGNNLTDKGGVIRLAVAASASNYVYALVESSVAGGQLAGIFRSADYGINWEPIETVDAISAGQGFHAHAIAVDPDDPNRVFAGMAHVQETANATAASVCWIGCSRCDPRCIDGGHSDFKSFVFVPDAVNPGNTLVLMASDGGVYVYNYAGNTVDGSANTVGLNVAQDIGGYWGPGEALLDRDLVVAALQDNGVVRVNSTASPPVYGFANGDGGPASISPDDVHIYSFSVGAPYSRWYSQSSGGSPWVHLGCSLGAQWTPSVLQDQRIGRPRLYTNTDRIIWHKPISSSCDWARVNATDFPAGFTAKNVDMPRNYTDNVFYVTGWGSDRLYVLDGATNDTLGSMVWVDRTPPLPGWNPGEQSIATADHSHAFPNTVYYTTGTARPSRAFLSDDRGVHWDDVTGNLVALLPDASYWELARNPRRPDELYLGTNVGIMRSDDRGAHWYRYMSGLPRVVDVQGLAVYGETSDEATLHVTTFGRGFWERTAGRCASPGDATGDCQVSIADVFYVINYLFAGGPAPLGLADANADKTVTTVDIFYVINYLFAGGPAPL